MNYFQLFSISYMTNSVMSELPYYGLLNTELQKQLTNDRLSMMFDNNEFVDYLNNLNSSCLLKELNFQYVTEEQLTAKLKKLDRNIELSVFHMNIRSLNSKQRQICQLFELLDYEFDVIILTEIWTVNINFYANLFTGYDFYYDLSVDSSVGGVGIFAQLRTSSFLSGLIELEIEWMSFLITLFCLAPSCAI